MSHIEFMKFCQNHWSLVYSQLSHLKSKNLNYHPRQDNVPVNRQPKKKENILHARNLAQTLVKCLEGFEMHSMSVTIVANLC
jgi:hypothetical protein